MSLPTTGGRRCAACGRAPAGTPGRVRAPAGATFLFQTRQGSVVKCWRCAVRHRPMLKHSVAIAAVVGTLLLAINQGDVLLRAEWPPALVWKVPLTYLVPFLVATWGALVNGRIRV